MYLYKHHLLPTSWCFAPRKKQFTMAGLETNGGEEVSYINLKCSKGKSWYYITYYLLAMLLPCCVLCPLVSPILLEFPAFQASKYMLAAMFYRGSPILGSYYLPGKQIVDKLSAIQITTRITD